MNLKLFFRFISSHICQVTQNVKKVDCCRLMKMFVAWLLDINHFLFHTLESHIKRWNLSFPPFNVIHFHDITETFISWEPHYAIWAWDWHSCKYLKARQMWCVTIFTLKKALPKDLLLAYLVNYQLMSWPQLTFTPKLLRRNSFSFSVAGNASVTPKASMLETVDVY